MINFGKRQKRAKPGGKPRKKMHADRHGERQPSQDKSGNTSSPLELALLCAPAGLPVAPLHGVTGDLCTCGNERCEQPGRHPRKHPTANRALIKKYWTEWPKAKIAVVLGAESGVLALVAEGSVGKKTLHALEEKAR